ncbi:hypothetical protein Q7C_178 [Methylophaga frappieri]|uniref:Uncharacterized protein n=1 Tax=Methylophaga frappieri (strain ATCC BAA-2434 / DSM 25690 / JAM7) TaxID=754477 RepID=I1YEL6_METFJ|nr:hypothetical protein [Methylophaga frappieri]AFJ01359.1 hypothetical protein Q7C_178 [Methylophaga frappieri]
MISTALKQADSIEQVVQIIDNGGTAQHGPEEIAGQYAYLVMLHQKTVDKQAVKKPLDDLMSQGAMFDYDLALQQAENLLLNLVET